MNETHEWMVEFPASLNPEITRRDTCTFYEEGEARGFMRAIAVTRDVTLFRRTVMVGDWEVAS